MRPLNQTKTLHPPLAEPVSTWWRHLFVNLFKTLISLKSANKPVSLCGRDHPAMTLWTRWLISHHCPGSDYTRSQQSQPAHNIQTTSEWTTSNITPSHLLALYLLAELCKYTSNSTKVYWQISTIKTWIWILTLLYFYALLFCVPSSWDGSWKKRLLGMVSLFVHS